MDIEEFHKNILNDTRIELTEEFDRNFERKAFFDKKWTKNKFVNRRGTQMARTNNLRRGYRSRLKNDVIEFSNSLPYASIHNEGGKVTVTAKSKRFFWAMYYKSIGAQRHDVKKTKSNKNRNEALSTEAKQWKYLALAPIGTKLVIPERRVIGKHPRIMEIIENIVQENVKDLNDYIVDQLKQRK